MDAINGYCKCGKPNGISGFGGLSCITCYNEEYERRFGDSMSVETISWIREESDE